MLTEKPVYLKPNVVIEPLFDNWYAWMHLISPATAARNVAKRHLPIMRSYVQAEAVHAAATKNPKMKGGPFVDYAYSRTQEVKDLILDTEVKNKDLLELSDAIDELNQIVENHPKGASTDDLYAKVPEPLKGLVELVFDTHNNLSFRLIEPLFYKSKFFDKNAQSVCIWKTDSHHRPFVLSTPRIKDAEPEVLHFPLAFDSEVIDMLGEMKFTPRPAKDIFEKLSMTDEQKEVFKTFFTPVQECSYTQCPENQVRVRYFGHACMLIETATTSILIDPMVAYQRFEASEEQYSYADLPEKIDYVIITHNHQDHVLLETLLPLRHKIKHFIVPAAASGALQDPSIKLAMESIGFDNIIELRELETIKAGDCEVTGIPFFGEHAGLNIQAKLCFQIKAGGKNMLFTADSSVHESRTYDFVYDIVGRTDFIFMGMECDGAPLSWLYGPLLSKKLPKEIDKSRRLNGSDFEQAIKLVDIFKPEEVYVYAMGQEPCVEFISSIKYTDESRPIVESNKLVEECKARNIKSERLFGAKEFVYEISK